MKMNVKNELGDDGRIYFICPKWNKKGEEQICPKCYDAGLADTFEIKDTTARYRFSV